MMFDFEEGFALFDMTPVDNQFIQEYLPAAKGDDVRVYLYGLMRCYHPENGMSLKQMSHDLNMEEEAVQKAYRYWERRGLVQRVSDDPVSYRYVSVRRKNMAGGDAAADPEYEAFADSLYEVFDHGRRLHGSEIRTCYEWVEDLGLPAEVVIMLLKHMEKKKGKNFTIQSAEPMAVRMAEEDVRNVEAAEVFLSRDQEIYQGTKNVLKRLGKRNLPSEDQQNLYRKWIREWQFTPEAILKACEQTAGGDPSMGYLDAILRNMRENVRAGAPIDVTGVQEAREEGDRLKKILKAAGAGAPDEEKRGWYRRLLGEFDDEMILMAARECKGRPTEDIEGMLRSWRQKGILTPADARAYIREFRDQSDLMRKLRESWGLKNSLGGTDRATIAKWEKEMGFPPEIILYAAESAAGAEKPMAYLNRILKEYAEKGIRTKAQIDADRQSHQERTGGKNNPGTAKTVPAQQYEQRDYSGQGQNPDDVLDRLEEMMKHA
ncbi:MAG: DnaD domain protein [Clostridia bacterium]|nr:DnaD domain protein [Clostridia bacterium]